MKTPEPTLMQHYGTAGVFREKTAGATPFAARVAAAVFAGHMAAAGAAGMDLQKAEAHQLNEQFRLIEERQMSPAVQNLQHTRAPMFVQAGSDLPVGWDEGMVRLASIAKAVGVGMAKTALGQPTLPGVPPMRPPVTLNQPLHRPAPTMSGTLSGGPASSMPVNPNTNRPMSSGDRVALRAKIEGLKEEFKAQSSGVRPTAAGQTQMSPPTQAAPPQQQAQAAQRSGGAVIPPAPNTKLPPQQAAQAAMGGHPTPGAPATSTLAGAGKPGVTTLTSAGNTPAGSPPAGGGGMMEGLLGKGWKGKALGAGALLGGGYLALKGVNSALGAMSTPPPQQQYGAGYPVPMGVNRYGYPQSGTG